MDLCPTLGHPVGSGMRQRDERQRFEEGWHRKKTVSGIQRPTRLSSHNTSITNAMFAVDLDQSDGDLTQRHS